MSVLLEEHLAYVADAVIPRHAKLVLDRPAGNVPREFRRLRSHLIGLKHALDFGLNDRLSLRFAPDDIGICPDSPDLFPPSTEISDSVLRTPARDTE